VSEMKTETTSADAPLVERVGAVLRTLDDLQEYLSGVVHTVRAAIPGCDAVGVTVVCGERPFTAAYTTAMTLQIDAVQYSLDEGPCLEAHDTMTSVRADLDEAAERWPRFVAAIEPTPTRGLVAYPLLVDDESYGALNLYAASVSAVEHADDSVLRATAGRIAEVVASGIALAEANELVGQLEQAVASRAVIEQAKGILMGRHGVDEARAFDLLREQSSRTNVKLRQIAASVVAGTSGRS